MQWDKRIPTPEQHIRECGMDSAPVLTSTPKKAPEPSLAAWRWRSLFRTSVASKPALSHSWRGMTWRTEQGFTETPNYGPDNTSAVLCLIIFQKTALSHLQATYLHWQEQVSILCSILLGMR